MTLEIKSGRRNLTFGSGEPAISHEEAINTLNAFLRAEQCHNATAVAEALYNADYRKQSDVIDEFVDRLKERSIKYRIPLLGLSTKTEIEDYVGDLLMQFRDAIDAVASQMKGGTE